MLRIKLEILKKIDIIDSIVVNSDSEEALAMADEFGVEQFRREGYYASSECNNSDFFQNLAENFEIYYSKMLQTDSKNVSDVSIMIEENFLM